VYVRDGADGKLVFKPGFGERRQAGQLTAGTVLRTNPARRPALCRTDRQAPRSRLARTGRPHLAAPAGGGQGCGYAHVGWSPAGFSGDELSSEKYPNAVLLKKSLRT
jgi:hypothetical protein